MLSVAIEITVTVLLAVLTLAAGHYFRWRSFLGGRDLPRLAAYTYGTLAMMLPASGFLAMRAEWESLAMLWMVVVSSGAAVALFYLIDDWAEKMHRVIEAEEREQAARAAMEAHHGQRAIEPKG